MRRALLILALLAVPCPRAGADELTAPFQIDGVLRESTDSYDPPGLRPPLVLVDLGSAEDRSMPDRGTLKRMTVVGTDGIAAASLYDIYKVCEFLCGDDGQTCHYVAAVSPLRALGEIGTPVAAIPGQLDVRDFRAFSDAEKRTPDPEMVSFPEPVAPIWSPHPEYPTRYRLTAGPGGEMVVETHHGGGDPYVYEDRECVIASRGPLDQVSCSSFSALMHGGSLLLTSFADYGAPAADVLASFEQGSDVYFVVRLALKAQTVVGLVFRADDGWRAVFLPRDYPLLC